MKIVYIMRGVPGSGKSTLARKLSMGSGIIHSTDDYFVVDGDYRFDPSKLREYHDCNFEEFCESLRYGVPVVICDNTNVHRWMFRRYLEAAWFYGYLDVVISMPHPEPEVAAARNVHTVPAEVIRQMIDQWEK